MEKEDKLFERIEIKKCIQQAINYLLTQSLTDKEFIEILHKLVKILLPKAEIYLMSVISNYAKTIKTLNAYENILDNLISKYCEVSNDNGTKN